MKKEFNYEIKEHFGTVSTSEDGKYATEVNLISSITHLQRWIFGHGTRKQEGCTRELP